MTKRNEKIDWLIDWEEKKTQTQKQQKEISDDLIKNANFPDIVCNILTEKWNSIRWHGTGTKEAAEKICQEWLLMIRDHELTSTAIKLGNNLNETNEEDKGQRVNQITNRPHLKSEYVVIISYPKEYYSMVNFKEIDSLLIKSDTIESYYTEEKADLIRPEFIKWYFDVNKMEFISNNKYYKNMWEEKQNELFQEVKKKYMDSVIDSKRNLEDYLQMMQEQKRPCPYNEKDITEYWPYTIPELDPFGYPIKHKDNNNEENNTNYNSEQWDFNGSDYDKDKSNETTNNKSDQNREELFNSWL